jgi:hypothetical protein
MIPLGFFIPSYLWFSFPTLCAAATVERLLKEELARLYHILIPTQSDLPIQVMTQLAPAGINIIIKPLNQTH